MGAKKRTYSARDIEDMVKIELEDAIATERKNLKDLKGVTDKEWASLTCDLKDRFNKARGNALELGDVTLYVKLGKKTYDTISMSVGNYSRINVIEEDAERKSRSYVVIDNLPPETKKERIALIEKLLKEKKDAIDRVKKVNDLTRKLENYKSIAARFRLGYTGDPSDLESINHKCREYLLKDEK